MIHVLKCWPEPFEAMRTRRKRYEIRRNDRGYAVGDTLILHEWDPTAAATVPEGATRAPAGAFTGRVLMGAVTYMTNGGEWGLPAGLCVMSVDLAPVGAADDRDVAPAEPRATRAT